MRLIDADKVPPLSDLIGCAYEGGEYQAYKSGAEYGRGLVDDAPTIDPESLRPTATLKETTDYDKNHIYRVLECSKCGTWVYNERWYGEGSFPRHIHYCEYCGARFVKGASKK